MTTLRELRRRAGLNQAGLAHFASERGTAGQPWISDIERGSKATSRPTVAIYALLSLLTPEQIEQAKAIIAKVEDGLPANHESD
ncbi:helix-turn-helix domain-containing protein [Roseomonas genomospecies 6]|uniref:XRE family transcriptional regulator n=1 Tax=Roseomonas genomospecies 6 TaxID=214106 RepID=A0A9W7KQN5_9PROT|nr:helix-turn-helix domain-containing protein [Roseomonas genomospecies 6]KAA0677638.1 XRE family transcriptional regulator [Roseomonas genomospecies 6]